MPIGPHRTVRAAVVSECLLLVRWIEDKLHHDTNTLKAEKDYMLEIKELKKNKPKLAQLGQMQDKVNNIDAGTDLRGKQGEINEAMNVPIYR